MVSKYIFYVIVVLLAMEGNAQTVTRIREFQKEYLTYPYSDPDPVPLKNTLYPYFRYDGFTVTGQKKLWKVVELENDYIRLQILPEIGGKVWSAIDKTTGKPFLYDNEVIKFRDIAMRGPWTSGGLEANFGIIGHTPNCATPVDYLVRSNKDGGASCFIGVFDLMSRSYWRVEICLPKDKAVFSTRTIWYNASALEQPYYHWMNAGLKASNDLELIYTGTHSIGHEGEHKIWPVDSNGRKLNWYKENSFGSYKSYHVFGANTDFSGAYWHNDDIGMVRYGLREQKAGTKLWIWGLSAQGMIWEKLLSDNSGQYVELQSGRLFNQNTIKSSRSPFKHFTFQPYGTDHWTEYWYPVKGIGGITKAADFGAIHFDTSGEYLSWSVYVNQLFQDSLIITSSKRIVLGKKIQLKTAEVLKDSVLLENGIDISSIDVHLPGHGFKYSFDTAAQRLDRPLDAPINFSWASVFGLYTLGKEKLSMKDFSGAKEAFWGSLHADSNYLPSLVGMSEMCYRQMMYDSAVFYATKALSIDTHDGASNYFYGLAQEALSKYEDAIDGFSIAALSPEWRSAAYSRLSRLQWKEGQYWRAINSAKESLFTNPENFESLQLLAYYKRKLGKNPDDEWNLIRQLDPLSHFLAAEMDFYAGRFTFDSLHAVVRNELPVQSWIERATWYWELGDEESAIALLKAAPGNAETQIIISWLTHQPIEASQLIIDFVFPFRPISYEAINWHRLHSDHWKLRYLQSLIFVEKGREQEAFSLLKMDGSDQINFAPYYAFRGSFAGNEKSLDDFEHAWSISKEWRYLKRISEAYNRIGKFEKSIALLAPHIKSHPNDYIIGLLYAKTLLNDGKYELADRVIDKLTIIPFEGATEGHELFREAKLERAVYAIHNKQYKVALSFINSARGWPERLGVGKPYDEYVDGRLEDWLEYICHKKMGHPNPTLVQKIIAYGLNNEDGFKNLYLSNNVVAYWAECESKGVGPVNPPALSGHEDSNQRIVKLLLHFAAIQ